MKLFYKCDGFAWENLYKYIDADMGEVFAIEVPYSYGNRNGNKCPNIIRLWNEEKHGPDFQMHLFCGEYSGDSELYYEDHRDFLYKINAAVGDEKDIVLAIANNLFSVQLVDYFVKMREEKGFRLHILMDVEVELRSADDRMLLAYLEHLQELDSVAFFNRARMIDTCKFHQLSTKEQMEERKVYRELMEEEAGKICGKLLKAPAPAVNQLWLYHWQEQNYKLIELGEEDYQNRKIKMHSAFESIAPNEGKETCHKLKEYREAYKLKYDIKYKKEEPCTYTGVCKGTCEKCEEYAFRLWLEGNRRRNYNTKKKINYVCRDKANQFGGGIVPINGISRLRVNTDGPGIRTLVVMNDCHLNCKYCINEKYINVFPLKQAMTASNLWNRVEKDALYFEMTGGGVTFGGGEPLLYPDFIAEFKMWNPHISVAVETSLNVPFETVESLTEIVDYWIVDVKDMNNNIYFAYTGHSNVQVLSNLKYLAKHVPLENLQCRLPLIKGYNTEADIQKSTEELQELGVGNIERFVYKI